MPYADHDRYLEYQRKYYKLYREQRRDKPHRSQTGRILPIQGRAYKLMAKYGMTLEQYDILLEAQNYGCAICGDRDPHTRWGYFDVDHDHITGQVRGLLCGRHNRALGQFKDNVDDMQSAIDYLRKFQ